jgi:hypothetical protein
LFFGKRGHPQKRNSSKRDKKMFEGCAGYRFEKGIGNTEMASLHKISSKELQK